MAYRLRLATVTEILTKSVTPAFCTQQRPWADSHSWFRSLPLTLHYKGTYGMINVVTTHPHRQDRQVLPATRRSLTHKFHIAGHEGYLTIGLHDDGVPGEIFIKMAKEGSTISGMCQAFCRAFSLSLQHGLGLQDACVRFKGMRFEPQGPTGNPDIPEASSIIDYVARYLELEFGDHE